MLTEADRQIRGTGIGSSEISAIAGENPFRNAHSVWLEKRGLVDPQPESDATWLGHEMEPIIAKRYAQEMGVGVVRGPGTQRHREHLWVVASTDYEWANGERIVECKWVGMRAMRNWTMDVDGAPVYCNLQMQWQMLVRDIDRADCAAIFGATSEFRVYEFRRDEAIIASLLKIGERFWRRVLSGEPPPVDESEEARQTLLKLYPTHRAPLKPAPPEAERWFEQYEAADAERERQEAAKKLAGNKLREMIGEAEGIEGPWGRATWKADRRGVRTLRTFPKKERAA